jgi:hypothetical protein
MPGGWPMREVLLADVALWGALIILAALIIIQRWRRRHSWIPARGPGEEAPELAGPKMLAPKAASRTGPGQHTRAPDSAAPEPARPPPAASPAAPPRATQMADAQVRPHWSGAQRDGRRPPARAATPGERIVSYYDHADEPIADYLAGLGWTPPPRTPPARTPRSGFPGSAPRRHGQLRNTEPGELAADRTAAKAAPLPRSRPTPPS